MDSVDRDLVEMMRSVFADARAARAPQTPGQLDQDLWTTLDRLGLTRLTGAEAAGGSGASWLEAGALLGIASAHAAAVPLAEHDLLAGWLLEQAGLPPSAGPSTAALLSLDGRAFEVPWVPQASRLVVGYWRGRQYLVSEVPVGEVEYQPRPNFAGASRASIRVDLDSLDGRVVPEITPQRFFLRGALARCLQICGALEEIVELCVAHTTTRSQFGRPLAHFQSVQHLVADATAESALARAATDAALIEAASSDFASPTLPYAIAIARSCAGHGGGTVVRHAHEVHGAIGTTAEHQLNEFTLPVLAWRSEFGSMRQWDHYLGGVAVDAGRDVWQVLTNGTTTPFGSLGR